MQGTRKEREGDRLVNDVSITDYPTPLNKNIVNCGVCNKVFYADKITYDGITRSIEQGLDNPFVCDGCLEEYELLAFER